ncbi:hypothetical protein MRX96_000583 [Rhipicephalus microplus]
MSEPKSNPSCSSHAEPGPRRALRIFCFAYVLRKIGNGILRLVSAVIAAAGAFCKWSADPRAPTQPGNARASNRIHGCWKLLFKMVELAAMLILFPFVTVYAFIVFVSITLDAIRAVGAEYYFIDYRTALLVTWAVAAPSHLWTPRVCATGPCPNRKPTLVWNPGSRAISFTDVLQKTGTAIFGFAFGIIAATCALFKWARDAALVCIRRYWNTSKMLFRWTARLVMFVVATYFAFSYFVVIGRPCHQRHGFRGLYSLRCSLYVRAARCSHGDSLFCCGRCSPCSTWKEPTLLEAGWSKTAVVWKMDSFLSSPGAHSPLLLPELSSGRCIL